MSLNVSIDHLVIAAGDLASGVEYVKREFGVEMLFGGEHEKMGTHNHLMQLGPDVFLEIIAINPNAKQPERPRWYGLDDPYLRAQIAKQPRLITWVVNTDRIDQLLDQAEFAFGKAELISRGNLDWYFALPDDGRLHNAGLVPYLMQWNTDSHPALGMSDLGCRLRRLTLYHSNPGWLKNILRQINALELVEVVELEKNQSCYICAEIDTPAGIKELSSKAL